MCIIIKLNLTVKQKYDYNNFDDNLKRVLK